MRRGALFLAGLLMAGQAFADVTSHGVSAFGDLKYPADFEHFDAVNPDAPKGGQLRTLSTYAAQTFDSLNPFILKGEGALEVAEYLFDTLMVPSYDEADAVYGLLAESITYPEDRSWAEFKLREEARFSDGAPVTADDVVFSFTILRDEGQPQWRIRLSRLKGLRRSRPVWCALPSKRAHQTVTCRCLRLRSQFSPVLPGRGGISRDRRWSR